MVSRNKKDSTVNGTIGFSLVATRVGGERGSWWLRSSVAGCSAVEVTNTPFLSHIHVYQDGRSSATIQLHQMAYHAKLIISPRISTEVSNFNIIFLGFSSFPFFIYK